MHGWMAFLIKIMHLSMDAGKGGRIAVNICIDSLQFDSIQEESLYVSKKPKIYGVYSIKSHLLKVSVTVITGKVRIFFFILLLFYFFKQILLIFLL